MKTVAVAVETLLLVSVTVRVTVLAPTLEQSKLVTSRLRSAIPQASLEPLSISAVTIVAAPIASNCTVISLAMATGSTLSSMVTVAVAVEILLLVSVKVRVTVLAPIFEQSKLVTSRLRSATPQASFEPLSISAGTIVAAPSSSNCTVIS